MYRGFKDTSVCHFHPTYSAHMYTTYTLLLYGDSCNNYSVNIMHSRVLHLITLVYINLHPIARCLHFLENTRKWPSLAVVYEIYTTAGAFDLGASWATNKLIPHCYRWLLWIIKLLLHSQGDSIVLKALRGIMHNDIH